MKILSIGNSFSQDSHRWLHSLAKADGYTLNTVNLYIGGCSLERHTANLVTGAAEYDMEGNVGKFIKKISLREALQSDKYDIVTLQQVSGQSGRPQSYFPFITELADTVKSKQPDAKLFFHKTWTYEENSSHPDFSYYNYDKKEMYRRISDAAEMVVKVINAGIIPTGDVIETLCDRNSAIDSENKIPLYRDGFHLTYDYGRLAAALVWYETITGRKPNPECISKINADFDINFISCILEYVEKILK